MQDKLATFTEKILFSKINVPVIVIIFFLALFPLEFVIAKYHPQFIIRLLAIPAIINPKSDAEKYLPQIRKLISLPDETPQFATVSNADKINDQPFFKNARNADIVVVFPSTRKSILYRPSENKIIEVGTINSNPPPTSATTSASTINP